MTYDDITPYLDRCIIKKLKRGDIIYREGEKAENLFYIKEGLLGLFHTTQNGRETFLRIFQQNSYFGHRSFFANENYHASSVALAKSEIIILPKNVCHELFTEKPNLVHDILAQVSRDLAQAEIRLASLQDDSANKRIAQTLLFLKLRHPDVTWTRKEIGEYSCSTQESVARLMSKLEKQGIIKKMGRDFQILDEDQLYHYQN